MFRFSIRDVLWAMVVVRLVVALWIQNRANATTIARLRQIAAQLASHLNGRDDLEVKVVNDHLYLRTGASQSPPPEGWPE